MGVIRTTVVACVGDNVGGAVGEGAGMVVTKADGESVVVV